MALLLRATTEDELVEQLVSLTEPRPRSEVECNQIDSIHRALRLAREPWAYGLTHFEAALILESMVMAWDHHHPLTAEVRALLARALAFISRSLN